MQRIMIGVKPRCYSKLQWGAVLNTILMKIPSEIRLHKIKDHMMTDADFDFMYPHLLGKDFCETVRNAYLSEPWLLMMFVTGDDSPNIVDTMRKICGATKNPDPGTIRHLYGVYKPNELHENAVHCSDSLENAECELRYFKLI